MENCSTNSNNNANILRNRKIGIIVCLIMIVANILLYSIERPLEPELVAKVRLDPTYFPRGNIYESWHAVYEAYEDSPGTWVHPHEYYQSRSIDAWPELDLENYTYIITYEHEIKSLSYYLFRENNVPTPTGAKTANLVLEEKTEPLTIYIYRIPKMRINNPEI